MKSGQDGKVSSINNSLVMMVLKRNSFHVPMGAEYLDVNYFLVFPGSGNECRKWEISTKIVKTRIIMTLFVREALYLNYVP